MSMCTSKVMPYDASLPNRIQALATPSVRNGLELFKALHIAALRTGDRMVYDE